MKLSLQLLPLLAGPLLAHSDLGHAEICGPGASLIPGGPACLTDPKLLADGDCDEPTQHAWTHSSPCLQRNKSDQQICVFTDTTFADGRGISMVTVPERAAYLATTPAFAEPDTVKDINQDLDLDPDRTIPAKYEMRAIPGKGMGLIATAPIHRGELIMANTASLMIDYRAFHELTKDQYTTLQAAAVSHLPPDHRTLLLNLSTHTATPQDTLSQSQLIDTILTTNSFDIDPLSDADPDQHNSFFVLFPSIARMNHDCRPNAEYLFSPATLSQSIRAARDIAPGEELTLSYIDGVATRDKRMRKLKRNWGFDCSCAACSLDGERARESDRRVEEIRWVKDELGDWGDASRGCVGLAELLVGLYEMERLWGVMYEAYTLAALEYNAVGDVWRAVKYARLGVEWGLPMVGEEDEDMEELRRLREDPWGHWSWERRVRSGGKGKGEEKGEEKGEGVDDGADVGRGEEKGEEKGREGNSFGYGKAQEILRRHLEKAVG